MWVFKIQDLFQKPAIKISHFKKQKQASDLS